MRRIAVLCALAAGALGAAAGTHESISSVSGNVVQIAPPPSVQLGALQSDDHMFAFDEQQNVTLGAALPVDISQPGQYGPNCGCDPLTPGTIPAGTTVSSQFVHADPIGKPQPPVVLTATVVTTTAIIGIEVCGPAKPSVCGGSDGLDASDAVLGNPGTSYPTGVFGRGMNFNTQPDTLVWMVDNHTVVIQTSTDRHADQVRIITAASEKPPADALTISKDAAGSYDDAYKWTINKDACVNGTGGNTGKACVTTVKQSSGTATFNYTVRVTHGASQDSNVKVTGTITIHNPNVDANNDPVPVDITGVTDELSDGTTCTVAGGGAQTLTKADTNVSYECDLSGLPKGQLDNTATVSWDAQDLSNGKHLAAGPADFTFQDVGFNANEIDECTTVVDDNATPSDKSDDVTLGTPCVGGSGEVDNGDGTFSFTYTFSRTYNVPANDCTSYTNTATFTTNDTQATGSDDATVALCGPAKTGALTIGFWKNTNGQNLINTYCTNGASKLGTYLAGLGGGSGPFSNAPSSCSALKTYVYNILNGANASNMNSMLKAQMLGTALDVWFSGPGWTSTKIGGVKPPSNFLSHNNLGTFKMDTTAVCPMVDNLGTGTATCQNNTPSTDAVAAGAVPSSPMSLQAILDYAATTPSPFNGSTSNSIWYGGNKTLEEILKNIFDQLNNQQAFGSF